ncbi:MAG: hypothetical protein HZA54_19855 [Planctomycetes bacterium]|nr:hypothetical protein [Planctomycetota bacterium]
MIPRPPHRRVPRGAGALALALLLVLAAAGCNPTRPNGSSGSGNSTPEKTFYAVRDAILQGDMDTVYTWYSARKKQSITLERLKRDYASGRQMWHSKYVNASVRQVSDDKKGRATMVVLYGDGQRWPPISLALEGDTWRIDD